MGPFHILWKRNQIYHDTFQKHVSSSHPHNTQHHQQTALHTKSHPTRQIREIRCIQTGMSRLQKKAYVGQTGRPFSVRFREHFRDYKHVNNKSKFAEHLLDHHHSFGPMNTTMKILLLTSKGTVMNTLEKYHIYNETHRDNQINDRHTVKPNAIFNTLIHTNPDQVSPHRT
jgi:hypothetical protein